MQPLWQAVWRMCPSAYTSPFLSGGWCEPQLKRSPRKRGVQRGATPLAGVWGCPPGLLIISPFLPGRGPGGWCEPQLKRSPRKGESRGVQPLWQGSGGVPQDFLLFLKGRGPGGFLRRKGVQRGTPGRGLGVSPRTPGGWFLLRKGARGGVTPLAGDGGVPAKPPIEPPSFQRDCSGSAGPTPDCFVAPLLATTARTFPSATRA